ncbi:hypothetical protein ABMA27_000420 [Loxostege sticticalis]|uniref:Integrase catalytic domain-containing protein n=1 Tax=Loxostege sticticalis TaxID=481309 RepID=A0ABR3INC7_LOXSC
MINRQLIFGPSVRSSATVKAQKTAAETAALRRRLEREQALAQRERERERCEREQERERERRLAALQEQLEETELQAELTAIEAENSCNGSRTSQRNNINRLHNALRGPARDAVAALLMSTEDPEEVMRALEDNFARPELIVYKEVNALKNLPRLGNDLKELGTICNKIIPVTVSGPNGACNVFALLDDGSTATLLDSSIATRIGATGPKQTITVNGISGLYVKLLYHTKTKLVEFVNHTHTNVNDDDNLEFLIKEQYKLDSIGITKTQTLNSKQEQRAVDIIEATSKRLPTGRFEVGMPWRDGIQHVPDSYPQAMSRFISLERRMSKDAEFAKAYAAFINNMITKGYSEECTPNTYYAQHKQSDDIRVYLPHFGVYHPQKRKDLLLPGPDLLQPLIKVLFRFRESCVGMTADIKEMFPQVRVREQDRDALRYLWRPDKTQAIKDPFIAQFIKNKNALEQANLYPKAVDAILFSHYMDDYIDSQDSVHEAAQLAADITTVHNAACFEMRGWSSNEREALKLVPDNLRATQSLEVDLGEAANSIRALGIAWNPISDELGFRTGLVDTAPMLLTKRRVLSHVMRVYPLGLLGPIVVKGRILFQQTWRSNIDWDTELPPTEASKWFEWFQDLSKISALKIPRWYSRAQSSEPTYRELHVFADASELAYACVAYWRLIYPDGSIKLTLIASKARVSPLKPTSIPRLELQAALIASRIALVIKESHRKKPIRTYFWTDSMTVLQWLRSDARTFKPFVAHRLGEILENSSVKDWRWVPTDFNVADDATRMRPINLDLSHRWFCGPSFLLKSLEDWPTEPINTTPVREELKCQLNELVGLTVVNSDLPIPVTVNFTRFSDWLRLLRATARVHQAAAIFRSILDNIRNSKLNNRVSRFRSNYSSAFSYTIIRYIIAGRVKSAENIDPETRYPILLGGRHPVVRLLIQFYHRQAGHANHEYVINALRERFWLLRLRNTVRSVAHECLFCKIRKLTPINPATGDLPPQRLAHHQRPFTFTGLDYFGPINVTVGRRHEKRYVALYTCLTTRALHLELVHSLSSDSAIMSLRRFIARRGTPNKIYSDNGTAFVGANRILREFYSNDVQEEAANRGIIWSFIPAAEPSFGGCWERLVGTVKVALKATLKENFPKEETLITLLMEAEAIANSRPLTHVSTDPNDPTTLTLPFHFLIGSSSNQTLPSPLEDRDLFGGSECRKALRLSDHFWKRWIREKRRSMTEEGKNEKAYKICIKIDCITLNSTHDFIRKVFLCWQLKLIIGCPVTSNISHISNIQGESEDMLLLETTKSCCISAAEYMLLRNYMTPNLPCIYRKNKKNLLEK